MLQFTPTMLPARGRCTNGRILETEKTEFQPSTPFDFYELTVSKEIPLQGHFLTNPLNAPLKSSILTETVKMQAERQKDFEMLKAPRFAVKAAASKDDPSLEENSTQTVESCGNGWP